MIRVKICGLKNADDAAYAKQAGADYLGMVFAESPRKVTIGDACKIVQAVKAPDSFVGVFLNAQKEEVLQAAQQVGLKQLQFHGDETPEYCSFFTKKGFQVIKAFPADPKKDFHKLLKNYDCPYYLLDTSSAKGRGGTGETFDWTMLDEPDAQDIREKLFISGGLTPENVSYMLSHIIPYAVDVSSGVEETKGRKSASLVRDFITRVKKFKQQ